MTLLVSDSMRESALRDIAHEIVSLEASWLRHTNDRLAWTTWFVHARNLLAFFDCTFEDRDELRAFHFFDPPRDWAAHRPECSSPSDLESVTVAANKLAAHLTLGRATYRLKGGFAPSQEVTEYLSCLAAGFERGLQADQRKLLAEILAGLRGELSA